MDKTAHNQLKNEVLNGSKEIAAAYQSLELERELWRRLAELRQEKGFTQEQVAEKLNTSKSAISRLESGGGKKSHSASLSTLRAYVAAIEHRFDLVISPDISTAA